MQQKALRIGSRLLGNFIIVMVVPGVAQCLDWLAHRVTGADTTPRAIVAVSVFATVSALFHLHVMRDGVFLAGQGRSLAYDFRRIPRLLAGFVLKPIAWFASSISRTTAADSEAAL